MYVVILGLDAGAVRIDAFVFLVFFD